jgi:hypothetical protein
LSFVFFEQELDAALVPRRSLNVGARGEGSEFGVDGDLFDGLEGGFGFGAAGGGLRAGQVQAGDLEAVEEQAGAARVELVGGDALQDLADGELDGGAVLGDRHLELRAAGLAGGELGWPHGLARGVVEVAKFFATEAWALAAAAVGEDVAAAEAGFGRGCG